MIDWSSILISGGLFTTLLAIIETIRGWRNKKRQEKAEATIKEAEANKAIIENWRNYADTIKKDNDDYRTITDEKIEKLEKKIAILETKDKIKEAALLQGWRCEHFLQSGKCPVLDRITQLTED